MSSVRQGQVSEKLNKQQIEQCLKSAVDELTPDIFDRLDLSVPQERILGAEKQAQDQILKYQRRMRSMALASAACICIVMAGGGAFHYHVVNQRVESVIGIDVNPSVELSINKKERVLHAQALNEDGEALLDGMDLEGVELNVAVNAVVGSMVTHGYLDDLDNAILVTVSNDSVRKAKELRASVVKDIENTLSENQLQAVVYDQQVIEDDEIEKLAENYDISYGKAYFLMELIDQNKDLSMEDMAKLSSMTMEEIANEIGSRSYALGELADQATVAALPETEAAPLETEPAKETTEAETEAASEPEAETTGTEAVPTEPAPAESAAPTTEAAPEVEEDQVEIDYVDCEGDTVYVSFVTRVNWKNPTVSVRDENGNAYAALVDETSRDDCVISVSGLEGGKSYTFVLGGLTPVESDKATTVTGYFEKPEIAAGATEAEDESQTSEDDEEDKYVGDHEDGNVEDDEDDTEETGEAGMDQGSESGGSENDDGEVHGSGQNGSPDNERNDEQVHGGRQDDGRIYDGSKNSSLTDGIPNDGGSQDGAAESRKDKPENSSDTDPAAVY